MKARTIIAAVLLMAAVAANAKRETAAVARRHAHGPVVRRHGQGRRGRAGPAVRDNRLRGEGGDSTALQTEAIQKVIDTAASQGGGVVVVPRGTFLTGSLFFRPGTHLHLREGARLKGSDAITHYKIVKTRLEGQTLNYFAALINADGVDGFTITGSGTIDGNGRRFYDEFWLRRKVFPKCTNLEALRPRMIYISDSKNVTVQDVRLVYSGFWTNHLYRCSRVRYIGCYIYAPTSGYPKGPSTDALDLDACQDVHVRGCYINVNDDAVCLKGGKGTFVDKDSTNGPCRNVLIENVTYGVAGAGVTLRERGMGLLERHTAQLHLQRHRQPRALQDAPRHAAEVPQRARGERKRHAKERHTRGPLDAVPQPARPPRHAALGRVERDAAQRRRALLEEILRRTAV